MRTALLIVALSFCACCKRPDATEQPAASASAAPAKPAASDPTDRIAALVADPVKAGLVAGIQTADTEDFTGKIEGLGDVEIHRLKSKKTEYFLAVTSYAGDTFAMTKRGNAKEASHSPAKDVWLFLTGPLTGTSVSLTKLPGGAQILNVKTDGYAKAKSMPFP